MSGEGKTSNRYIYMDAVRIIGCLLVICLHMATLDVKLFSTTGVEWKVMNFMESVGMNGIALFFMISGALFLRQESDTSLKYVWKKIGILLLVYIICLIGYNILPFVKGWEPWEWHYIKMDLLKNVLYGEGIYHLVFLPTLMVLYALSPILKPAFAEKKLCEYFLVLFVIFGALFPYALRFEFEGKVFLQSVQDRFGLFFLTGHLGYFVLGHYLHEYGRRLSKKGAIAAGVLAVCTVIFTMLCNRRDAVARNDFSIIANTPLSVTGILFTGSVFCLIRTGMDSFRSEKGERLIKYLASLTFGIYLVHPLIMNEIIKVYPWNDIIPVYGILVICRYLFVVITAGLISAVLKKIPLIKKLL